MAKKPKPDVYEWAIDCGRVRVVVRIVDSFSPAMTELAARVGAMAERMGGARG